MSFQTARGVGTWHLAQQQQLEPEERQQQTFSSCYDNGEMTA